MALQSILAPRFCWCGRIIGGGVHCRVGLSKIKTTARHFHQKKILSARKENAFPKDKAKLMTRQKDQPLLFDAGESCSHSFFLAVFFSDGRDGCDGCDGREDVRT
ncbi:MAG TPA: hypothetical protein VKZ53_08475 [Candidatus Angelobacter sp.]|nr:hypothetical protein [Candidatus Angelobacter sp.]